MSAGELPVVEDLGTVECGGAACGRMVGNRWVRSTAVRVRVGTNDRVLCPVCARAQSYRVNHMGLER